MLCTTPPISKTSLKSLLFGSIDTFLSFSRSFCNVGVVYCIKSKIMFLKDTNWQGVFKSLISSQVLLVFSRYSFFKISIPILTLSFDKTLILYFSLSLRRSSISFFLRFNNSPVAKTSFWLYSITLSFNSFGTFLEKSPSYSITLGNPIVTSSSFNPTLFFAEKLIVIKSKELKR